MKFFHSIPSQYLIRYHPKITQILPRYPLQLQYFSFSSKHHKSNNNNTDSTISNKTEFRSRPINKSILAYIESIGIGKKSKSKFKSGRRSRVNKELNKKLDILEDQDEKMFFASTEQGTPRRSRSNRRQRISPKNDNDGNESRDFIPSWLPPAPFGNYSVVQNSGNDSKYQPVKILGSVASIEEDFPRSTKGLAEIAIVGRSNVGKSTLLNALLYGNYFDSDTISLTDQQNNSRRSKQLHRIKLPKGRKASVSNSPGETKAITFYQLSSSPQQPQTQVPNNDDEQTSLKSFQAKKLVLVDLPGYGFAFTSELKMNQWRELMHHFLTQQRIKRMLLLIDARHGFKTSDYNFLASLQSILKEKNVAADIGKFHKNEYRLPPIQVVLTKCDLVKQKDLARRVVEVKEDLSTSLEREPSNLPVMLTCAKEVGYNMIRQDKARGGILELQRELAALA